MVIFNSFPYKNVLPQYCCSNTRILTTTISWQNIFAKLNIAKIHTCTIKPHAHTCTHLHTHASTQAHQVSSFDLHRKCPIGLLNDIAYNVLHRKIESMYVEDFQGNVYIPLKASIVEGTCVRTLGEMGSGRYFTSWFMSYE